MKKLLLGTVAIFASAHTFAQVVVAGISPSTIQRNFEFGVQANEGGWPGQTDNGTWSMVQDFNITGTFVQAELMIIDDGTAGNSPVSGLPHSNYGCSPAINDLTGKIAVVYRFDGSTSTSPTSCDFSEKAYNAQQAGAVAVIIVNREAGVVEMAGGTNGTDVTIPVIMLSKDDGALLRSEMANGPVVMFIGNKFGINTNDVGSDKESTILSTKGSIPSILAQNAGEYKFTPGIQIVNYGTATQNEIFVTAKIDAPGLPNAYVQTVGPLTMDYQDTLPIFRGNPTAFPIFSLNNYPKGEYTLTYTISLGTTTDESPDDNEFVSKFYVTDDVHSYATFNTTTNKPVVNSYPKNHESSYRSCIRFNDPNASRAGAEGMYFAVNVSSEFDIQAQEIFLTAFKWDDVNTIFSATPTFDLITEVGSAVFYPSASYQNGEETFVQFNTPFLLLDDQNYLFCVETQTDEPSFGYDGTINYNANNSINDSVISPIYIDNDRWFAAGWSGNPASSIGIKLFPAAELNVEEAIAVQGSVYPNPANDKITINMNQIGAAKLQVTDISGKVCINTNLDLKNGSSTIDINNLESGVYLFNVEMENGFVSQFNVVKK